MKNKLTLQELRDIVKTTIKEERLMEEVKLVKSTLGAKNTPIIKITDNVIPYIHILKKYRAEFSKKWKQPSAYWFWFIGKEGVEATIEKYVKPALVEIQKLSQIDFEIQEIIDALDKEPTTDNPEEGITSAQQSEIRVKLKEFKEMLVNIDNDEDFKNIMGKLIDLKAAQGYGFTIANIVLIVVQNPNATIVNSRKIWRNAYKREIKPNAKPLYIYYPKGKQSSYSKDVEEKITQEFLKSINKQSKNQLTPKELIDLEKKLRIPIKTSNFTFAPVYDVSDTVQIKGTEDYIEKAKEAQKDIKWFEDNMLSDEVRPIYKGLLAFAEYKEITVDYIDDLDGARGSSASGAIKLLRNEGNDVGLTKTLAHEITHELLHQSYLKNKGDETSKFYVGRMMDKGTIEQQAELSAWMFMYAFGFDVKTTSLNYTVMWGGDKDNMIKVFDTVSGVVNYLINYVNDYVKKDTVNEIISENMGKNITPTDIADVLGLSSEYKAATRGRNNSVTEGINLKSKITTLLREGVSPYYNSFSEAVSAAKEYAEKGGYEIDEDDWFTQIGTGGKYNRARPSIGKTHSFSVGLTKDGKPQRKNLNISVYGMESGRYELTTYIN
jgi:hypothetical protein